MRYILTHPGKGHVDDLIAVALAATMHQIPICRREPTQAELDDPTVMVIDVGCRWEPDLNNFDHHQFARGAAPCCAATLLFRYLGLEKSAREFMPWLQRLEIQDCRGPTAAAMWLEIPVDTYRKLVSPIEAQILQIFQQNTHIEVGGDLHRLLTSMGQGWLDYLNLLEARMEIFDRVVKEFNGQAEILDLREIDGSDDPTFGLTHWLKRTGRETRARVTISNNTRDDGLCLYHFEGAPVDFSKLEGHPEMSFVHKSGHMAITRSKDVDVYKLINAASVTAACKPTTPLTLCGKSSVV